MKARHMLSSINSCKTLDELCHWLRKRESQELAKLAESGKLNLDRLPNFGGEQPENTLCLSYDKERILIEYQTCDYETRFAIIDR